MGREAKWKRLEHTSELKVLMLDFCFLFAYTTARGMPQGTTVSLFCTEILRRGSCGIRSPSGPGNEPGPKATESGDGKDKPQDIAFRRSSKRNILRFEKKKGLSERAKCFE